MFAFSCGIFVEKKFKYLEIFFAFLYKGVKLCFSEYVAYAALFSFVSTKKFVPSLEVKISRNAAH